MTVHFSLHHNAGEILSGRREKESLKRQENAEEKMNSNINALVSPLPLTCF